MFSKARHLVEFTFKFFIPCHLLWISISLWTSFVLGGAIDLDPSRFSEALKKVQDNVLGVKKMQEYFDGLTFEHEAINGVKLVDKLSKQLKQRFSEKVEIANELRVAIEEAYRKNSITSRPEFSECCKTNPTKIDYRFRRKIFADKMCFTRASSAVSDAKYLPKSILDKMKKISKEKPNTKWQYFGSQKGVYYNYPAVKWPTCSEYDHRVRPWYVKGIAPEGKDIVIILDKSGSMAAIHGGKTLMDIAIDAASTVLDSLNSKDKVGIVAFSTEAQTPGSRQLSDCYDTELAQAVPVNIKYLKRYLKDLKAKGSTQYSQAMKKAFDLLKSTGAGNETLNRKKVILFLTDGEPTDFTPEHILDVLKEEKEALKNATSKDAVIFAYGIGKSDYTLLRRIADDTEAEGTKGTFTAIKEEDINQLRSVFSSFYDLFARTVEHRSYSLSVPYYDQLGLGVLVSVVVPCWFRGNVVGVAGTDVVYTDLISDVFYFSKGEYSYAFLIDRETGNTLIHPQMPTLQSANDDPVILHITALEQAREFENVLKSMTRGEEGHLSFLAKRFFPVGSGIDAGVREIVVNSTYYWKAVEGTNLAVCVVLSGNETILKIDDYGDKSIIYHREIDLVKNKVGFTECSHFGNRGTNDRAVVKFSPQSFEKPFVYLTMTETENTVKSFKAYIKNGVTNPEPEFKHGVREMVVPGFKAEEIWDSENSIAKDYVSYFTYATSNGIILLKPGGVFDKSYDPTKRPWFQNAVNNKGKLSLSTPYLDALGSGFLVDVVHTLQEKNPGSEHPEHDDVIAVVDASFGMFQFYRLFTGVYSECLRGNYRCFIMDKNGFLIMHKHFVDFETLTKVDELVKVISSIHITMQEKGIAEDLINRNILRRKQCKKYKKIALENFYEVHLTGTLKSTACPSYQISQLDGTNAFLGIVDDSACRNKGTCACPSSIYTASKSECVCPFNSKINYNYCKNEFPGNEIPLCPVTPPLLTSFEPPMESKKDLVDCNKGNCSQAHDEGCFRQKTCSWCQYDKEKRIILKKPLCVDVQTCYGGVKGLRLSRLYGKDMTPIGTIPNMDNTSENKENANLSVIVACVVVVLVLLVLVLVVYIVRKKYLKKKNKQSEPENSCTLSSTSHTIQQPGSLGQVDRPQMPEPGYYEIPNIPNARSNMGMTPPPYIDVRPPSYYDHYTQPNEWR